MEALVGAALRLLPDSLAFAVAKGMASRPARAKVTDVEAKAASISRGRLLPGVSRVPALEWGDGPVVCLVHGWGGRATQMALLGSQLAERGFRAVAIDIAGHGKSEVAGASWRRFMTDTAEASAALKPVALIGHSAGGLAMMGARGLLGLSVPSYVCICAPHHPYPPLHALRRRLNPTPGVVHRFRQDLAMQFGLPWAMLEEGAVWEGAGDNLLLAYDDADRYVSTADAEKIRQICPDASFTQTVGYGHNKVLGAKELADAIGGFLLKRLATLESDADSRLS